MTGWRIADARRGIWVAGIPIGADPRQLVVNGRLTPRAAIEAGYDHAMPAILDSNLTTFLAGIVLFQFGSGPVKGFAVTLCVGIITTVFTAVVITRTVYDYLLSRRRLQTVSI